MTEGEDPVLTLPDALSLLDRAKAHADDIGVPMSFAVVDAGGHLLAFERMDGAPWISAEVAQGKAFTAAAYAQPSAAQAAKARDLPQFAAAITVMTGGRYTPQDGGLPIERGGACVGGIGASGGTGQQDAEVCRLALADGS
jgi:uncharacterized protein GlcG (DUF336 family)